MGSDNQYTALGPAIVGFQTDSDTIDHGAEIAGNTIGIFGECASGIAISALSVSGIGVSGESMSSHGVFGFSASETGVVGASAIGDGIRGSTASDSNSGVVGENTAANGGTGVSGNATAPDGVGVAGNSEKGVGVSGTGVTGVFGKTSVKVSPLMAEVVSGPGVFGTTADAGAEPPAGTFAGTGVVGFGGDATTEIKGGILDARTGYSVGVWGTTYSASAVIGQSRYFCGVQGVAGPEAKVVPGIFGPELTQFGVYGIAANKADGGAPVGVFGQSSGDGANAVPVGVFGDGKSNNSDAQPVGVGGYASGSKSWAMYAYNTGSDGAGMYATNAAGSAGYAIVAEPGNGQAAHLSGTVTVDGALIVTGAKSAAVSHKDGTHRLLYAIESPESWFEDFGEGELVKGKAQIQLAPDFAGVVKTKSYYVFLTENGDSNGLYVSRRDSTGFSVRERGGGSTGVSFSYRIVCKRSDIEVKRLATIKIQSPIKPPEFPAALLSHTKSLTTKVSAPPRRSSK